MSIEVEISMQLLGQKKVHIMTIRWQSDPTPSTGLLKGSGSRLAAAWQQSTCTILQWERVQGVKQQEQSSDNYSWPANGIQEAVQSWMVASCHTICTLYHQAFLFQASATATSWTLVRHKVYKVPSYISSDTRKIPIGINQCCWGFTHYKRSFSK